MLATSSLMGQQQYEQHVQREILALTGPDWRFDTIRIGSLRSGLNDVRRVPQRVLHRAPLPVARLLSVPTYRTSGLVHRFDLRVPPPVGQEVVTIHDLPPLRFRDEGTLPRSAASSARRARIVICPSRFAADEVQLLLGVSAERIRVIPNGVSDSFQKSSAVDDALLRRFGIRKPYALHAGGATDRKNLPALADAWRHVAERVPDATLVLAGPDDQRRTDLFRNIRSAVLIGARSQDEIASLMTGSSVVVVPSTYEGFGLPALEAMAVGRPVVAARAGALPEVCEGAALLVEPTAHGLATALIATLTDADLSARLGESGRKRAEGFTWSRTAVRHLETYREVLR